LLLVSHEVHHSSGSPLHNDGSAINDRQEKGMLDALAIGIV
jgi:hypothetical protein